VGPIFNVKTSETDLAPAENFDGSTGFGVNLASAFPARGNLGFELDWAWYPKAMHTSDQPFFGDPEFFASKLMTISTNFFYSPGIAPFRPYFSVGPTFGYRSDHDDSQFPVPSGWAVGINGGGGVIAFVNQRFGGRVDFRYQRNFGDFYDISPDAGGQRRSGWADLQFFRLFFGATVVL
jgi:hypothetical protein